MSLGKSIENLVGVAKEVAKLGVEPEARLPKLVKTSSALDLRAVGLALINKDLKDDVIIVHENNQNKNDDLVYLVDNELTRQVVEERYGRLLAEKGLRPIIRTKTVKNGDKEVVALHVPLLDAQVALAYTGLGVEVPKLYCGKTLDKKAGNYSTCGDEVREHYARFVLGEEASIPIQERRERSKSFGGRIVNIEEDAVEGIKVSTPVVARQTLKLDKELHEELKAASGQIGRVAFNGAKHLAFETINVLGEVGSGISEVSRAIVAGDEKQVDVITDSVAKIWVAGLNGSKPKKT